jgi:predicted secreted protein
MAVTSIIIAVLAAGAASSTPTASAPAAPATQAAPAAKAQDKVVCQASQVTGSLVRKRKACQTKGTWAKQSESHQNQWQEIQGTLGNTRGN